MLSKSPIEQADFFNTHDRITEAVTHVINTIDRVIDAVADVINPIGLAIETEACVLKALCL